MSMEECHSHLGLVEPREAKRTGASVAQLVSNMTLHAIPVVVNREAQRGIIGLFHRRR